MTIGIFVAPLGEKEPTGLSLYIKQLARSLVELDSKNKYILYVEDGKENYLSSWTLSKNVSVEPVKCPKIWLCRRLQKREKSDIYVFNTPVMPPARLSGASVVIALDFAYKHLPPRNLKEKIRNFLLGFLHRYSLSRADGIVAISEATRRDIVNFFRIPKNKVRVIYPGFNRGLSTLKPHPISGINYPFFLYAGVVKERKNTLNVVKAFAEFQKTAPQFFLVIAGRSKGEYAEEIKNFIKTRKLEGKILFLGYVSEEELVFLYRNATALLYPSLVEGFGFPVLEAFSLGLPVITSNQSSLPEVAGEAAILVNPHSTAELTEAMQKIASDSSLREELIKKGKERAADFSWERSARDFLRYMEELKSNITK